MSIGVTMAFITEFMDKTVKDDKFIEQMGWTHLGSVLQMTEEEIQLTKFVPVDEEKASRQLKRRV
jgi:hypothetical protein